MSQKSSQPCLPACLPACPSVKFKRSHSLLGGSRNSEPSPILLQLILPQALAHQSSQPWPPSPGHLRHPPRRPLLLASVSSTFLTSGACSAFLPCFSVGLRCHTIPEPCMATKAGGQTKALTPSLSLPHILSFHEASRPITCNRTRPS